MTTQNDCDRFQQCSLANHIRYEHLLAGMSGGVVATSILHPLDTLRTRLAASSGVINKYRPNYGSGLYDAFTTIIRRDGFRGLYRGVGLGILTSSSSWGSYFFFYDAIKVQMQNCDPTLPLGPARHMLAAAEAGVITLLLTNPIWVVKTRLCLQFGENVQLLSEKKRYKNMADAFIKTYSYEGFRGLYKGFLPGLFNVSHGALQFMLYEEMKDAYNDYYHSPIDTNLNTMTYVTFAALSKLVAGIVTYPWLLIRTRMQDQFHEYSSLRDALNQTWRHEGSKGFYKGLVPSLLRVTPATAITFVVYEKMSHFLTQPLMSSSNPNASTTPSSSALITDVPVHRIQGPSST